MKKQNDFDIGEQFNTMLALFRFTRIFVLILVLGLSTISASAVSQVVTIHLNNVTLQEVFKEITKLTGYDFLYNNDEINQVGKVSINAEEKDVHDVLSVCLHGTRLGYVIKDQVIVISPKVEIQKKDEKKHKAALVTGWVVDRNKKPLSGVSVLLKGTVLYYGRC